MIEELNKKMAEYSEPGTVLTRSEVALLVKALRLAIEALEKTKPVLDAALSAAGVIQTVKDGNWEPEDGDYFDRLRALRHAMFCGPIINEVSAALSEISGLLCGGKE